MFYVINFVKTKFIISHFIEMLLSVIIKLGTNGDTRMLLTKIFPALLNITQHSVSKQISQCSLLLWTYLYQIFTLLNPSSQYSSGICAFVKISTEQVVFKKCFLCCANCVSILDAFPNQYWTIQCRNKWSCLVLFILTKKLLTAYTVIVCFA